VTQIMCIMTQHNYVKAYARI